MKTIIITLAILLLPFEVFAHNENLLFAHCVKNSITKEDVKDESIYNRLQHVSLACAAHHEIKSQLGLSDLAAKALTSSLGIAWELTNENQNNHEIPIPLSTFTNLGREDTALHISATPDSLFVSLAITFP